MLLVNNRIYEFYTSIAYCGVVLSSGVSLMSRSGGNGVVC